LCENYDLCEKCEAKGAAVHDPSHPIVKISVPLHNQQFGGGRGCPYRRNWGPRGGPQGRQHNPSFHHGFHHGVGRQHGNRLLARFVQDVTVPDGTVVEPNADFTKIWRVRNEGEVAWPEHTVLCFAGGDRLGASEVVNLPLSGVLPGQEVDVFVNLTAPSVPGRYISYWKLCGPYGFRFGQRMWADVNVDSSPAPAAVNTNNSNPSAPSVQSLAEQVSSMAVDPPVPAPAAAVEPVVASTTPHEAEALKTLVDMGFHGDLLAVLRKNSGDVLASIRELLG